MAGEAARGRMTVAAFLEWASGRPEGERWELVEGAPVPVRGATPAHAMAAETVIPARIKRRIDHTLSQALAHAGHACEVFVSGPKVRIDTESAFEPDVVVTFAEVPDGMLIPEPLIVVEVLSASTRERDSVSSSPATPGWRAWRTTSSLIPSVGWSCIVIAPAASRTSGPRSSKAASCASSRRGWVSTATPSTPAAGCDRPPHPQARCQSGSATNQRV
jgi:Putative restriction endonuclease